MAIWTIQRRMFVHILARTNIGGNIVFTYLRTLAIQHSVHSLNHFQACGSDRGSASSDCAFSW